MTPFKFDLTSDSDFYNYAPNPILPMPINTPTPNSPMSPILPPPSSLSPPIPSLPSYAVACPSKF